MSPHARAALAALALLLGACAPTIKAPPPGQASWEQHLASLASMERYQANGRLASRELDLRADFRLQRDSGSDFQLRLSGPLGSGAVELLGDVQGVTVRSRDGESRTTDPEAWIQQRYGWQLPVASLGDWLLGRPHGAAPDQLLLDAEHRAARFSQQGWQLDYLEYQQVGTLALPRRVLASNGRVTLTLLVDRWQPAASTPAAAPSSAPSPTSSP